MVWVIIGLALWAWAATELKIFRRGRTSRQSIARNVRSDRWWGIKLGAAMVVVILVLINYF